MVSPSAESRRDTYRPLKVFPVRAPIVEVTAEIMECAFRRSLAFAQDMEREKNQIRFGFNAFGQTYLAKRFHHVVVLRALIQTVGRCDFGSLCAVCRCFAPEHNAFSQHHQTSEARPVVAGSFLPVADQVHQ